MSAPAPTAPGWYVQTPAGLAGPYTSVGQAQAARPPGTRWPVLRIGEERDARRGGQ